MTDYGLVFTEDRTMVVQALDSIRVLTIWIWDLWFTGCLDVRFSGCLDFLIFQRLFDFRFSGFFGWFFRMFGFSRVFQGSWILILDLDIWFFRIGHRCLLIQRCKRVRGNEKIFD
jgi:hypothetical protein